VCTKPTGTGSVVTVPEFTSVDFGSFFYRKNFAFGFNFFLVRCWVWATAVGGEECGLVMGTLSKESNKSDIADETSVGCVTKFHPTTLIYYNSS